MQSHTVHSLPLSTRPVVVHHADARSLPFDDGSIELALTLPPYIHIHNYQGSFAVPWKPWTGTC